MPKLAILIAGSPTAAFYSHVRGDRRGVACVSVVAMGAVVRMPEPS